MDIRQTQALMVIMNKRLDVAVAKNCDAVDPDNVNGYDQDTGFPLSASDQLTYNRLISSAAHARNLSCALKNDLGQISDLVDDFDFQVNEQCHQYNECDKLDPFIQSKFLYLIHFFTFSRKQSCFCS